MNKLMLIAIAIGASAASGQTLEIEIRLDRSSDVRGTINATGRDFAPGTDLLAAVWDFAGSFRTSQGTIDLTLNPGFTNPVLSPNTVFNNNSSNVSFLGVNATQLLASPAFDGSNPIQLATFSSTGPRYSLELEIDAASYGENIGAGFPNVPFYPTVNISISDPLFPTPGTAVVLGLGSILAARRRR